jgi:hypothetical protein
MSGHEPVYTSCDRVVSTHLQGMAGPLIDGATWLMDLYNENPSEPDLMCNQLDALGVLIEMISSSECCEDLESITDTAPRESMCCKLGRLVTEARDRCSLAEVIADEGSADEAEFYAIEGVACGVIKDAILAPGSKVTWTNSHLYRDGLRASVTAALAALAAPVTPATPTTVAISST